MLKNVISLPYGITRLEIEYSGTAYQNALSHYVESLSDLDKPYPL